MRNRKYFASFSSDVFSRVLFKTKSGELKEEFWEDKNLEGEELVKMGQIDNFQFLRGSLKKPKRKPNLLRPNILPETITKGAEKDPIFY